MVSSNKKAPWATGVVTKALCSPDHSTHTGLRVYIVGGGLGLLLAFSSWKKPGNDPAENEPHDAQHQGSSDAVHRSTHEVGHLFFCGRGANHDIPNLAEVITWGHFAQVNAAIGRVSICPASQRCTCYNQKGQRDVEAFNAFKDVHSPECITGYLIFVGARRLSIGCSSCYSCAATPVKRGRVWRPVPTAATQAAVLIRSSSGFVVCAPSFGGSMGGPQGPAGSRKRWPVRQPVESPPSFGDESGGLSKPHRLESIMAHSSPAQVFAPTHPHIVPGLSLTDPLCAEVLNALPGLADPGQYQAVTTSRLSETALIQLHADAHNALNMAVFYLRQQQPDTAAARTKAIQALYALRNLSLSLEA